MSMRSCDVAAMMLAASCALAMFAAPVSAQDESADETFSPEGPWADENDGPRDEDEPDEQGERETVDVIPVPQAAEAPPYLEESPAALDEITVTAQKRVQRVQDVPVSISVLNDTFITRQGITDVKDLLLFVPNMKVETGSTLGGPRCRGFGLNIRNRAFEPPCGVAIDGVPYTASDYFDLALFDIQRVEVLRGPQGTTFGKNTTAGVINVITKNPTAQDKGLVGSFGIQLGDLNRRRGEAALGGSLFDGTVNYRIAGLKEERDGYLRNTTADVVPDAVRRPLSGKREGVRAKLAFEDLFGSRLMISYDNTELRAFGFGAEPFNVSDTMAEYMREFDPDADFEKGNFITSIDYPDRLQTSIETWQLDWSTFIGGWTLNAVGAHSVLTRVGESDADYFPAPVIIGIQSDISPTTSFELRGIPTTYSGLYGLEELFGWDLGTSDLLAGVFYQERRIDDGLLFLGINDPILLNVLAIDSGAPGPLPSPPGIPLEESVTSRFTQSSETLAAFAEFQWYFADAWMLQYGMRLSKEDKTATWDQQLSDPHPVLTVAGWAPFAAAKERSENQFLPKIALNYKPWSGVSLFLRWTRGFKGGGFNAFSQTGESSELTSLTFGPEKGEEWAFDAKMELFDNQAHVNFSLFRLDVKDFQYLVQVDDPVTGFPTGNTVVNVGHARAQGIEADLTWLPTSWLRIIATIGMNDSTFVDFPFNSCPQAEENTDGDDDPRCDVSGRPFPFTPRWNNTLTFNLETPVADLIGFHLAGTELRAGITVEHVSEQFLNADLNAASEQPGFLRYRANIGFANREQGWSFSVNGENLTDEITSTREDAILGVSGNYLEPRRVIYSQFRLTF